MKKKCLFVAILSLVVSCLTIFSLNFSSKTNSNLQVASADSNIITTETGEVLTEDNHIFINKKLYVYGEFDSTNYTVEEKRGNLTILIFETLEETQVAYTELSLNPNINVELDPPTETSCSDIKMVDNVTFPPYDSIVNWEYNAMKIQDYLYYLDDSTKLREVVVAVIDSGINTKHELFKDRILKDSSGNFVGWAATNEGEKVVTQTAGYEFEDDRGHGTHVAGIICQSTPTNVKILPIKLIPAGGTFYTNTKDYTDIFEKIANLKSTYNIVAVNMSFGGYNYGVSKASAIYDSIQTNLINNGIIPVAAAGNDALNTTKYTPASATNWFPDNSNTHFPSALDNVICVSALKNTSGSSTSPTMAFDSSYSNYGSTVDFSAPGTSIRSAYISSTSPKTAMAYLSGTSMATPCVSAIVALCSIPRYYYLTGETDTFNIYSDTDGDGYINEHVFQNTLSVLKNISIDLGSSGYDTYYGYGMPSFDTALGKITLSPSHQTRTYNAKHQDFLYSPPCFIAIGVDGYTTGGTPFNKDYEKFYYGFSKNDVTTEYTSGYLLDDRFKDAGTYTIYLKCTIPGYADSDITATQYTIKTLTVSINIKTQNDIYTQTFTYGDQINLDQTKYEIYNGLIAGDDLGIILYTDAEVTSSVGKYNIYAELSNKNYTINESYYGYKDNQALTIIPRPITIDFSKLYYGCNFDYSVKSGSLVGEDSLDIRFNYNGSESEYATTFKAGTYTIENKNTNYELSNTTVTIKPRPIVITAETQSLPYGDIVNLNQTKFSIRSNIYASNGYLVGLVNDDTLNISLSTNATSTCNVGKYNITIDYSTTNTSVLANYNITTLSSSLNITPRQIDYKIHGTASWEYLNYDNRVENYSASFVDKNQIVNNDTLTIVHLYEASESSTPGTYNITAKLDKNEINNNYTLNVIEYGTLTITKCKVKIDLLEQTFTYGDKIILDNSAYDINAGYSSKTIFNDILGINLTSNCNEKTNAGSYKINVSYTGTNYYELIMDNIQNNTSLTINKKSLNINLWDQECYYGSVNLNQNSFNISGVVNNDKIEYKLYGRNIDTDTLVDNTTPIGEYRIFISFLNSDSFPAKNYQAKYIPSKLTIIPRPITISTYQTSVYGDEVNVSNDASKCEITCKSGDAIVNDDIPEFRFLTNLNSSSNAGTYNLTTLDIPNDNYDITFVDCVYEITKRPISISLQTTKEYGSPIDINKKPTFHSGYIVNNDDLMLDLSTTATQMSPIGTYKIIINSYNSNYDIILNDNFTYYKITPRNLTILSQQVSEYGNCSFNKANYSIVKKGKDGNYVADSSYLPNEDLKLTFSTNATTTSPVGKYSLFLASDNSNFNITLAETSYFKVITREITCEIIGNQSVYGDPINENLNIKLSKGSIVNNDKLNIKINTSVSSSSNVGTYPIDCSYENTNYNVQFINNVYIVTKRPISIKLYPQKTTRGIFLNIDQSQYEITSGSVVENTYLDLEIISDAKIYSPIGTYKLSAICHNENYDVTIEDSTLQLNFSVDDGFGIAVGSGLIIFVLVMLIKFIRKKTKKRLSFNMLDI